ncbi:hypothetical protein K469DRAFT_695688 [Zopfia rhizophila CBS 207.26]|uniref:Uncharacterized protein n=1 Tax=Zopfia rhizophila CBS 207.26 TaxID=1314779 RepID=A0A6A6DFX6_9PEZI|nr:hypothetical protein K469DRAFT_695688 [Zopfia rhizophila CBS 207.26]
MWRRLPRTIRDSREMGIYLRKIETVFSFVNYLSVSPAPYADHWAELETLLRKIYGEVPGTTDNISNYLESLMAVDPKIVQNCDLAAHIALVKQLEREDKVEEAEKCSERMVKMLGPLFEPLPENDDLAREREDKDGWKALCLKWTQVAIYLKLEVLTSAKHHAIEFTPPGTVFHPIGMIAVDESKIVKACIFPSLIQYDPELSTHNLPAALVRGKTFFLDSAI